MCDVVVRYYTWVDSNFRGRTEYRSGGVAYLCFITSRSSNRCLGSARKRFRGFYLTKKSNTTKPWFCKSCSIYRFYVALRTSGVVLVKGRTPPGGASASSRLFCSGLLAYYNHWAIINTIYRWEGMVTLLLFQKNVSIKHTIKWYIYSYMLLHVIANDWEFENQSWIVTHFGVIN